MTTLPATEDLAPAAHATRAVVHRTRGSTHGPITRLMSPGDLGQALKPFNFSGPGELQRPGRPPALRHAPAFGPYLAPSEVAQVGPAHVLLGCYGTAQSLIQAPSAMTYLAVTLRSGERWRCSPPAGHAVAWAAVASGRLLAGEPIAAG